MAANILQSEVLQCLRQSRREWKTAAKRELVEAVTQLLIATASIVFAGLVLYALFKEDLAQILATLAIDWSQVSSMFWVTLCLIFVGWVAISLGAIVFTTTGRFPTYASALASIELRRFYAAYKDQNLAPGQPGASGQKASQDVEIVLQHHEKALYHAIVANQAPRDKFGIAIAPSLHEITADGLLLAWGFSGDDDPIHEYLVPWATLGVPPEHQPHGVTA